MRPPCDTQAVSAQVYCSAGIASVLDSLLVCSHARHLSPYEDTLCRQKLQGMPWFSECRSTGCDFLTLCSAGGQTTQGAGLHTEPDLVDAGRVGGNPKAGMPTGSHAAAASSAATGKTPKFVPEGAALKAGMPTGAESLDKEFSRGTPGAELAARKSAAQG